MIERINVDTFVKEMGDDQQGLSRPVEVMGDNGKNYILKNQNVYIPQQLPNGQITGSWVKFDSMFMHEILVFQMAKFLGVSVPDVAIANVDQRFLTYAPTLQFAYRYEAGSHFASHVLEGVENNLMDGYKSLIEQGKPYKKRTWKNFFASIDNKEEIPRIIALDLLTANFDRFGNKGNLLIVSNEQGRRIYAIDHGHCFWGPIWNNIHKQNKMRNINNADASAYIDNTVMTDLLLGNAGKPMTGLGEIYVALEPFIDLSNVASHSFMVAVEKIESISTDLIDSWFDNVPDEWFVDKHNQIALYKHFLYKQKDFVRRFISRMAALGAFDSSYLGGDLQWNVRRTGTQ